jgi:DNA-binding transcriptional MocR family regulator
VQVIDVSASASNLPPGSTRKWERTMQAITADIRAGEWRPGDQLPTRAVLAERYGVFTVMLIRAQHELEASGVLRTGGTYGRLYVKEKPPHAVTPPQPEPPPKAARARNPRAYSRPDMTPARTMPARLAVPMAVPLSPPAAPVRPPAVVFRAPP